MTVTPAHAVTSRKGTSRKGDAAEKGTAEKGTEVIEGPVEPALATAAPPLITSVPFSLLFAGWATAIAIGAGFAVVGVVLILLVRADRQVDQAA